MKVSLSWLKELVDYNLSPENLADKISLASIGIKQQTEDYLELDLTYNRGDLLSMRGVAYEVSALTDTPLRFLAQTPEDFIWVGQNLPKVEVEVWDKKLCPVYCVAKIEGLKVKPSNKDIIRKLTDCGIRSVDNITDITNLMMLEYGQTMHAFDAKKVAGETMIVRLAKDGEQFQTLDGKVRKLTKDDLLIADPKEILSLSGIMGGKNSEIMENTSTILLEVAIFDPLSIRKSSQQFGLHSEASKRIQHGLSKMRLLQALDSAIRMYQDLGGKLTAINLVGSFETTEKKLDLRVSKVNSLLGVSLDEQTITNCLAKLNFSVIKKDTDTLEVTIPYFRQDCNIEEDLVEEVARIYGYEKIPGKPLKGELPKKIDQSLPNFIYDTKKALADAGLTEVQTYSFYSTQVLSAISHKQSFPFSDEKRQLSGLIKIANPISSETEYLRNHLWPNLVEIIGKNMKQGYKDIAIFEIGKAYLSSSLSSQAKRGDLPKETYRLAIALMNGTDNPIEELLSIVLHIPSGTVKQGDLMKELEGLFHPTRFATIKSGEKVIGGIVAEVHPRFLNNFGIDKRVAVLEISIEPLSHFHNGNF